MDEVSDKNFIDRKVDKEEFGRLLAFNDEARLLIIADNGDRGKSHLLKRLKYICEWETVPPVPVSLIPLDQLTNKHEITLVTEIRNDLKKLHFQQFDELYTALKNRDASKFRTSSENPRGIVDARQAQIGGNRNIFAGTAQIIEHADQVILPSPPPPHDDWNNFIEDLAQSHCINAFFDDLRTICQVHPIVILLDSVDDKNEEVKPLKEWVHEQLTKPYLQDRANWPHFLILVLAGRRMPDYLSEPKFSTLVRSASSLRWEEEHVRDFLKLHGYEKMSDEEIKAVYRKIKDGWGLLRALGLAKHLSED